MAKHIAAAALHAAAALMMLDAGSVMAQQDYPTRPVRFIVAYPPGASNDFLARLFAPKLTEIFGRQFIVDNRGGGNTIIGTDAAAKSAPDGHTMQLSGSSQVTIPHLYRSVPYDVINDFAPIAGIARNEFVLVVHPALPVKTVRELIDLAKRRPGELNYATSSTGGATHLTAVRMEMLAGVKLQQVPYKGGGPAMMDLLGGQIQIGFANPASSVPLVRSGRLRGIAVTGETRIEAIPHVPTFTESGLPGMVMRNWYAVVVPAATPKPIIERLGSAFQKSTAMADVKSAIVKQGLEPAYMTAEQIDAMRREDYVLTGKLIKAANIKVVD